MKITVEIPNEIEHEGVMYEPTGEYRAVSYGEIFKIDGDVRVVECLEKSGYDNRYKRFIYKPKRWRAERGDEFYYIDRDMTVEKTEDVRHGLDNTCYETGNYFQTEDLAQEKLTQILEILK